MLKRVAEQNEEKRATESPQKKATTQAISTSPKKEYPYNITIRKIIDPESNDLLAVTLENSYPILTWIRGEEPIHDVYVPATGKQQHFINVYTVNKISPQVDLPRDLTFTQSSNNRILRPQRISLSQLRSDH